MRGNNDRRRMAALGRLCSDERPINRKTASYALMTRESFVAERRGNVWRERHTSLGRLMVWHWFDRRSATRSFGVIADRGGKPTATFGGRSVTKDMDQ